MAQTVPNEPETIPYAKLANVLPTQRLLVYSKTFNTTDPVELHGAYIWSVKCSAAMYPLLSALEVALRNSIHNEATQVIAIDWYDQLATRVRSNWPGTHKIDTSNIAWHKTQVAQIKYKIRKKQPPVGLKKPDLLVAKMDFGFWDNLLRECFSVNGNPKALWPQCIPKVFPNLPQGHTLTNIQLEITSLRELRNDIAHHSPVWKHGSVSDQKSAIKYLNDQIDKILEIISWLSTDKVDWLEVHMLQAEARRIASEDFLYLCQRKNMDTLKVKYSCYKRAFRSKLKALEGNQFNLVHTLKEQQDQLFMVVKLSI